MPFQLFSSQSWSNGLSMSPQHGHPGDLPHYTGAGEASPISLLHMSTPSTTGISPATGLGGELYRELGTSESLLPEALSTAPNQPLYYVATGRFPSSLHRNYQPTDRNPEAALPHIIQVINTMSPQYKVIVLVPPESQVSTSMNSLQSPASPFTPGHNEVDPGSINQQSNSQYLGCLCYPHHIHFGSHMQPTSRSWFGSGQYAQFCPLHKTPIPDSSQGPLPVRML